MYECDIEGYDVLNTGNHHKNTLYDGTYRFDSPGLYVMVKNVRGYWYRMELVYDSEDLGILVITFLFV